MGAGAFEKTKRIVRREGGCSPTCFRESHGQHVPLFRVVVSVTKKGNRASHRAWTMLRRPRSENRAPVQKRALSARSSRSSGRGASLNRNSWPRARTRQGRARVVQQLFHSAERSRLYTANTICLGVGSLGGAIKKRDCNRGQGFATGWVSGTIQGRR